ncbi:MAG: manganese efflux pump [Prolixibacteraceae bacterium]|nr:manganese efflux pump [Prolixibacteraceae bacterium]
MEIFTIFLIAFSLSFDSFAVSVTSGLSLCRKHLKFSDAFKIAITLAVFQALMPLIGWLLGSTIKDLIQEADHWIALALLSFLGVRMIIEGTKPVGQKRIKNPTHWKVLITMAIATSIDALAVGISFAFLYSSIVLPVIIIGVITFLVSMSGIYMGKNAGKKIASKAEIIGGVILIAIGLKIFIEHIFNL